MCEWPRLKIIPVILIFGSHSHFFILYTQRHSTFLQGRGLEKRRPTLQKCENQPLGKVLCQEQTLQQWAFSAWPLNKR